MNFSKILPSDRHASLDRRISFHKIACLMILIGGQISVSFLSLWAVRPEPRSEPATSARGLDRSEPQNELDRQLLHAVVQEDREEVQALLGQGANVNTKDKDGQTPLHLACKYGHLRMAQLLVAHGADVNEKNDAGDTPLDQALLKGHSELIQLLVNCGAQVDANKSGSQIPPQQVTDRKAAMSAIFLLVLEIQKKPSNQDQVKPLDVYAKDVIRRVIDLGIESGNLGLVVEIFNEYGVRPTEYQEQIARQYLFAGRIEPN